MNSSAISNPPPVLRLVLFLTVLSLALNLEASPCFAEDSVQSYGGCKNTVTNNVLTANPANYYDQLEAMSPGDRLQLVAGSYDQGLDLFALEGSENLCFVIEGPPAYGGQGEAVFTGDACCNTVQLSGSRYVVVRGLTIDGLGIENIDAVKAQGQPSDHITLEQLNIINHGGNQQTVGISTKIEAWNWVVRRNRIVGAGTGMYFGNSDGEDEFVNSLIEDNVVLDTIGYNLQIKHQNNRDNGTPASGKTIIRNNIFSKANNFSTGGLARPNVLVGHWPLAGSGEDDHYELYGNFFWQNPSGEALFQGEGNVALYNNTFVNNNGSAIWLQPQNDVPREIHVFQNTIVAQGDGIFLTGAANGSLQDIRGNAVFAGFPITGPAGTENVTDTFANASTYLANPTGDPGNPGNLLSLSPLAGALSGNQLDLGSQTRFTAVGRDFQGHLRNHRTRGAYTQAGNPQTAVLTLDEKVNRDLFTDSFERTTLGCWD